jgi:RimJ/RimL family protein N-acetyltransferase
MDYLADIEANSWKLGAGSAIKLNPGLLRFIKCTAEHAAKTDRLVLSVAFLDDTPVAGVCGLVNDQRLLIYKIGYDDKFKDYSVGQHAMLGVVQYAFDHNDIKWVDSCAAPNAEMFNRCLPERHLGTG